MAPRFQQAFLGQRAGGDQPHHVAFHDRLVAAFLGLRGALHLLADRHAKPLADQRQQVAFGGMHRHAAHGDILALMLAAFGERDVQRLCRGDGIVKEHLVKIAHAVEQQRVLMVRFKLEILRHHWRYFFCLHGCPLLPRGPYKTPRRSERGCGALGGLCHAICTDAGLALC